MRERKDMRGSGLEKIKKVWYCLFEDVRDSIDRKIQSLGVQQEREIWTRSGYQQDESFCLVHFDASEGHAWDVHLET